MNFPKSSWFSFAAVVVASVFGGDRLSAQIPIVRPAPVQATPGAEAPKIPIVTPAAPQTSGLAPIQSAPSSSAIPIVSPATSQPSAKPQRDPAFPPIVAPTSPPSTGPALQNQALIPIVPPIETRNQPAASQQEQLIPILSVGETMPGGRQAFTPSAPPRTAALPPIEIAPPSGPVEPAEKPLPGEFQSFLAPVMPAPRPSPVPQPADGPESRPIVPRVALETSPAPMGLELLQRAEPDLPTPRVAELNKPIPGQQDYFSPVPMDGMSMNPSAGACANCGGQGCNHCNQGDWGGYSPDDYWNDPYGAGGYGGQFDNCGFVPRATVYGIFDALYWTRTKGSFIGTTFGGLPGFDNEWGLRATLGGRVDNVTGYEVTYFGIMPLEQSRQILSPGGGINALFEPAGGLNFGNVSGFFSAVDTVQFAESRLHSVEFNRVRWGWDIVKTHIGMRYIYFDDRYQLQSENFFGSVGDMEISARNHMFGGSVGVDLFYDVGRRVSFSWFAKAGGYANAQRTAFELTNNGTQFINNANSNGRFSASVDAGVNAHMHLRRNARLRAGYSGIFLWKVASATENYPAFVTPLTGLNSETSESLMFHGATFGLEIYR